MEQNISAVPTTANETRENAKWHVVFGAGQIGWQVAERLAALGLRVRVVRRSDGPVPSGTHAARGDALDPAFVMRVTEGAAVIYHCMNPSAYDSAVWEGEFPRLGEGLIAAAVARDARLVCLDNVYAYGEMDTARKENSPLGATGRKGMVRVRWAQRLEQAARENGLRYVAGKAGDFFGPGADEKSALGEVRLMPLLANKTSPAPGERVPDRAP